MSKDPAFLFYPNDYIGGTMGMTFEEKGAYMELLMLQFNRGHMTKHMIDQTIGQLWNSVSNKFIKDIDGLFYNERLEEEQNKRKRFTESRRNNKKGVNQHTSKPKKKSGHTTSHMENENEDVNIDYKLILETFNSLCGNLPKIRSIEKTRKTHIDARIKEDGIDDLFKVFKLAGESAFLNGKSERGWIANFDWVIKSSNFNKIIEGNYNKETIKPPVPTKHLSKKPVITEIDSADPKLGSWKDRIGGGK